MLLPSSSKAPLYPSLLSVPRLTTLFASVLVAICSGTNYVYSAYAPQLGARLQINHTQLNIVGLAGNIGVYATSPVWGRIVDSQGPRMLLASGFFLLLAGYSGIRYIFDAGIQSDATTISTFTFCLLVACKLMTGAGGNCGIMSSLNSTAKTFPDKARGLATGIVVSGFGLSAFLFSAMARTISPGDTSAFLKLLAYGTALPMILGFFFVRPIPLSPASADHASASALEHGAMNIDIGREERRGSGEEERLLNSREDEGEGSRYVVVPSDSAISRRCAHDDEAVSPNVYGKELFMKGDFWLLFVILSLLTGTGLMFINNVGSMSQALYFDSTTGKGKPYDPIEALRWQTAQVSSISITNFAGRIAIGLTSDLLKRTLSLPRSASLTIVSLLFLSSQIAAASISDIAQLEIASLMLGFAHGSVFSLGPTVCIEWFGMPHFSENWGYLIISPMFGGNLLSLAFGRNMDRHSRSHYGPQSSSSAINATAEARCEMGRLCYVDTLYLTIGVCMLAMVLSVWAGWRDWKRGVGRGLVR